MIKSFYELTNKKDAMKQIGKKYNRMEALRGSEKVEIEEAENKGSLGNHHYISNSRNTPIRLFSFLQSIPNDPAKKVSNQAIFDCVSMIN